jgi:transcriptional regulator with XRE-family HTH domain
MIVVRREEYDMENYDSKILGERIKSRRKELRMSQEELGSRIGFTKSSISRIEHGDRAVSFENINKIASVLEVDQKWLLGWTDEVQFSRDQLAHHVLDILENMQVGITKEDPLLSRLMGYINLMNDSQKQSLIDYAEFISANKKDPDQS